MSLTLEQEIKVVEANTQYKRPIAFAFGIRRRRENTTLDVFYPKINYQENFGIAALISSLVKFPQINSFFTLKIGQLNKLWQHFERFANQLDKHPNVKVISQLKKLYQKKQDSYYTTDVGVYFLFDQHKAVESAESAYFRLQCLSHRCVKPHELSLDGAFGKLTNIAWSNYGPILPEDIEDVKMSSLLEGKELTVSHIDKFPYLVNYLVPSGVRIASGSQVRLGAYLGEGTTVMPAGYINFNAGTVGNAMVEGRVSAGVLVQKDSDIGGGASIMGTLSGGNKNVISIGEKCLIGANAGTGISLGKGCTIAAGLYIYGGMKISLYNEQNQPVNLDSQVVEQGQNVVKANDLSGRDYMLFIQDSQTGEVICKPNKKVIELNAQLHSN